MRRMNKAEQRAIKKLAEVWAMPYRQMRQTFHYSVFNGCWMGYLGSTWFGIESDGYTHT